MAVRPSGVSCLKLRPFQKDGVRQLRRFKGKALLADEQGLGKTIQALFFVGKLPKLRPVFIICPASLKYNWQAEALLHFGIHADVIEGTKASARRIESNGIYILNYEIAHAWRDVIKYREPAILIVDECHYIKNISAKRTKAVTSIAKSAKCVLALSGTPLTNRPIELWPILRIIDPNIYPDREKFAWRYCKPTYTPWGWQYNGATNLGELNSVLRKRCMIRRLKADVLSELPPKQRIVVPFKLDSYAEYHRAENDFLSWLKELNPVAAKRAKKSKALTRVGYLLRLVSDLKQEWVTKWVKDFLDDTDEKLVVFTGRTKVVDYLSKAFDKESLFVDGRVTKMDRMKAVRLFQNNPKKRLFIGNYQAAGVGLTLTASANIAFLDLPFTPGELGQAEDRVHRIGQEKQVMVYYLVVLDTIEEKLSRIIQTKSKVLSAILDQGDEFQDIDIFNELINAIKKKSETTSS